MSETTETRALRKEISRLRGLLARNGIIVVDRPNIYPSDKQFDELLRIVLRGYPLLKPADGNEAEFQQQFQRAFFRLAFARRVERFDGRDIADLKRECEDWLARQGFQSEVSLFAFEAAAVGHGDIKYSVPPFDAERFRMRVGIELAGGLSGRGYDGRSWKVVLDRNMVSPPSAIEHDRSLAG
jgi:hypothetical protein